MSQRVLVVEDDDDARDALALILASQGYELETAGDGVAAIAKARAFHPDVLICDWRLPGMDGVSVARNIQRMGMIPVIFVTAHSVPDLRHRTRIFVFTRSFRSPSMSAGSERHCSRSPN